MNCIAMLFAIIALASAAEKEIYKLPAESSERLNKFAIPCAKQFNVDVQSITRVADGTLPQDEAHNNFLRCFTQSAGFTTEDGHMVVDKLVNVIKEHPRAEEVRAALTKCNEITKESPMATLVAMNKCFAEAPPLRFVL